MLAIENTQQYNGVYHVLGGIISPIDGVGPNDIEIDSLVERVKAGGINFGFSKYNGRRYYKFLYIT